MSTSFSVILLLVINLGLIWLLIAAPVGRRTLQLTRVFKAPPRRIAALVSPLGAEAHWHPSLLSSEALSSGRVKQTFSYPARRGAPTPRTLAVGETMDGDGIACADGTLADHARVHPAVVGVRRDAEAAVAMAIERAADRPALLQGPKGDPPRPRHGAAAAAVAGNDVALRDDELGLHVVPRRRADHPGRLCRGCDDIDPGRGQGGTMNLIARVTF